MVLFLSWDRVLNRNICSIRIFYHETFQRCYYHSACSCKTSQTSKIASQNKLKDAKTKAICQKYGRYVSITECNWKKNKMPYKNYTSKFLHRSSDIEEKEIIDAILKNEFFGIVECDISSPDSVVNHFSKLNFPPIFQKVHLSEDMVQPKLINDLNDLKRRLETDQLTLTFNAKKYLLTTEASKYIWK